jgi:hypothetical protein
LERVVALEPTQPNFLRIAELLSELGDSKAAAKAFKQIAQLTAAAGEDPARWYERAYQEDSATKKLRWLTARACWDRGRSGCDFYFGAAGECGEEFPAAEEMLCRGFAGGGTLC